MRTILLIFSLFPLKLGLKSPSPPLNKILSKQYHLSYSDESRLFVAFDSASTPSTQKGIIDRNQNYMISISDSEVGMLEDSTCFYLNHSLKIIDVGPRSILGSVLVVPLLDPYEIVSNAIENKMVFQEYVEDRKPIYEFISFKKDNLIRSIVISFYNDHTDSFSIRLIYQQYNRLRQDVVRYKFEARATGNGNIKIADFLDLKDGKYLPKDPYKAYWFSNTYLLLKK